MLTGWICCMSTICLYSTVKNTSGIRMRFGFLPPHGRELDVDEELSIFGFVAELLDAQGAKAFQRAIDAGYLEILDTPNPIVQDAATAVVQMVRTDNGSITVADTCWGVTANLVTEDDEELLTEGDDEIVVE